MTEEEYKTIAEEYERRFPGKRFAQLRLYQMNQFREALIREGFYRENNSGKAQRA